jgi:hypothetical protein
MNTIIKRAAKCRCNTFFILALPALLLLMTLTGCEKTERFRNETRVEGRISFLDILNARSLILGGQEGALKSDGTLSVAPGSSLFKITEDGVIQEIRYWQIDSVYIETEEGIEIEIDSTELTTIIYPVHIFDAAEDYLIICFNEENEGDPHHPYEYDFLIRKSDGAVYELPPGRRPETRWTHFNRMFANEDASVVIQHDEQEYIYMMGAGDIYKLSTRNPDNLTMHQLTTGGNTGEGVMNYRVNGEGHIVFNSGGISTPRVTRVRFSNGGLAFPETDIVPFWVGFDNNFYFSHTPVFQGGEFSFPIIERMKMENGQIISETVGSITHPDAEYTYLRGSCMFKLKNLNKIVALDLSHESAHKNKIVAEVYNNEQTVKAFSLDELGITAINIGVSSGNYYYLSGLDGNQPVLLKVDPSVYPHTSEHLLPRGSHDIYKMVVTSDDYVAFHALRMSDGNIIIGEITSGGAVTELEDIGTGVMQLVRIQ